MAREYAIVVTRPGYGVVTITPDEEIPEWARGLIDARHLEDGDDARGGDGPPPQTGKGSGRAAWIAYAEAHEVDIPEDASREDIIAACAESGVPVE